MVCKFRKWTIIFMIIASRLNIIYYTSRWTQMRNIVVLTSFAAIHSLDNLPIDNREFIVVTETLTVSLPLSPSLFIVHTRQMV